MNLKSIYNVYQHIEQLAIYRTRNGKKIIDHIWTNIPSKVAHKMIIRCPWISVHDAPCIVASISIKKIQPRFKNNIILKMFKMYEFMFDFKLIPFSTGHSFDKINNQLDTLNKLIIGN